MAGLGLLAYVNTSKYADYLLLYRSENIFERNGSRSAVPPSASGAAMWPRCSSLCTGGCRPCILTTPGLQLDDTIMR